MLIATPIYIIDNFGTIARILRNTMLHKYLINKYCTMWIINHIIIKSNEQTKYWTNKLKRKEKNN